MNVNGIALFTLRAAGFGLIACLIDSLVLRIRGRKGSLGRLLAVFYIASLFEITVLRGGITLSDLFDAQRPAVQWVPLHTTLNEFNSGAWPFMYHIAGNLMWFVPLGMITKRKSLWAALLAGVLASAAIECLQWVFVNGITDVDDVILNTCGTWIGYLLPYKTGKGVKLPIG